MTRPKNYKPKPNGRPQVHFVTEKPCKGCGITFSMEEKDIKHPSWFADVKYCSAQCREATLAAQQQRDLRSFVASKSFRDNKTGCLVWTGRLTKKGYGRLDARGKTLRAHRVAYELAKGPIPRGLMLLHSCDNPACVNPDHLRPGTARENMRDCISRGRARWQKSTTGTPGQQCPGDE